MNWILWTNPRKDLVLYFMRLSAETAKFTEDGIL